MYPPPPPPPPSSSSSSSSCSSSSHGSMGPPGGVHGHLLARYGSAPSSLLTTAVDSIAGQFGPPHTTRTCNESDCDKGGRSRSSSVVAGLQRSSYWLDSNINNNNNNTAAAAGNSSHLKEGSSLVRHSSSPAGFLNRLATATSASDNVSRGLAGYNSKGGSSDSVRGILGLNSQLSFTKDCLSQITEENENVDDGQRKATHSYNAANFGMGSWGDTNGPIMFSPSPSKRAKTINSSDIDNGFNIVESQLQFGLSETALEMAAMENLIDIPQDSVPCKIRAKRGCATHPRSIAERVSANSFNTYHSLRPSKWQPPPPEWINLNVDASFQPGLIAQVVVVLLGVVGVQFSLQRLLIFSVERRTRISGKLKKLQDLVPNMDKQTSYADMLDLAVQHIKGLQTEVQIDPLLHYLLFSSCLANGPAIDTVVGRRK
ncbi:hypothetical protein LguiA_029772 [Lonicera macranthoides]